MLTQLRRASPPPQASYTIPSRSRTHLLGCSMTKSGVGLACFPHKFSGRLATVANPVRSSTSACVQSRHLGDAQLCRRSAHRLVTDLDSSEIATLPNNNLYRIELLVQRRDSRDQSAGFHGCTRLMVLCSAACIHTSSDGTPARGAVAGYCRASRSWSGL